MKYLGTYIFVTVLYICFIIARATSNYNRKVAKSKKEFWENEAKANQTRRQDISNLDYVVIPMDQLPIDIAKAKGCQEYIDKLSAMSQERIINLSAYTNTELKLMYGPANLNDLSKYDESFTLLIRLLEKISSKLMDENEPDAAQAFLEFSISIGSSITQTYIKLGTLYKNRSEQNKLEALISTAEKLPTLNRDSIVNKLKELNQPDQEDN